MKKHTDRPKSLAPVERARDERLVNSDYNNSNLLSINDLKYASRAQIEDISRAMSTPVYLGGNTMISRVLSRYKVYLDNKDEGFGTHVLLDGFWEMWITQFVARLIQPGMLTIDVGANFGYYTLLLADLVGNQGTVLAIEPNANSASFLQRSVLLNGFADRTSVIEAALGSMDGTVMFFSPMGEPKNAKVIGSEAEIHSRPGELSRVQMVTLDAIVLERGHVDFVKIDAEGGERDILFGGTRTIETMKPDLLLEFNAARTHDPGAFVDWLLQYYPRLRQVGYDGVALDVGKSELLEENVMEDRMLYLSVR